MYRNHVFFIISLFFAVAGGCSLSDETETVWYYRTEYPVAAEPVIADGRVYVCSDRLYCLNAVDGKPVWQFDTYGNILSSVVVKHGNVYFQCGGIYSLDAATGKINWEFWEDAWRQFDTPEVTDQHVYSSVGKTISCVDVRTGKRVWKTTIEYAFAKLAASETCVYVGSKGTLSCLDGYTGKKLWHSILGDDHLYPAFSQGKVYAVSGKGNIFCIDGLDGAVHWHNKIDGIIMIKPIVLQNFVYVGSNEAYCFSTEAGKLVWKSDCNAFFIPQMQIAAESIYCKGWGKRLFRFTLQDGEQKWEYEPAFHMIRFTVHDDLIYAGSNNHMVVCLKMTGVIED